MYTRVSISSSTRGALGSGVWCGLQLEIGAYWPGCFAVFLTVQDCVYPDCAHDTAILLVMTYVDDNLIFTNCETLRAPLFAHCNKRVRFVHAPVSLAVSCAVPQRRCVCVFLVIWRERTHRHGIDHVPVTINDMRTEYFVNVSVGSPRQTFTVLIDTASSTLAIFSKLAPTHGRLAVNDGELDRRLKVRLCHCGGHTNCVSAPTRCALTILQHRMRQGWDGGACALPGLSDGLPSVPHRLRMLTRRPCPRQSCLAI